ncbi:MAG TPA: AarF/ABC1/UbiB kinase family protein [Vicinamibacterales bacterium]|nr:AarF/ABC1/UbiB kinase family protein [Vicinamibacterales bacterium]
MSLSLHPERLKRYKDVARLLFKYGRSDLVRRAGLDEALAGETLTPEADAKPEELATDLERLGPAFIKLGQLLSTRADLLPSPYLDALGRLQDRIEPFSFAEVERVIHEDLGVRISKAFAAFDAEPMAAASLGQVHRAALRDGRRVAVKVQRPNIRDGLAADLATMEDIAGFLDQHTTAGQQFEFVQMVAEFRRTLAQELDYQREAHNLVRIAANLSSFRRIVVPAPVEDYTSARVLTMEFIQGQKITTITPLLRQDFDAIGLARELFRAYLHQIIVDGFFHADPHPGNVLLTEDRRIALIDLGMVSRLSPSRQDQLLKLLLAVSETNGDRAAALAMQIGDARPDVDQAALRRDVQGLVSGYAEMSLNQLQVGRVVMEISRAAGRHGIRLPPELTLLGKTLLNLDEVGRTLAPDFDVNAALKEEGPALMQRRMQHGVSAANVFSAALETKEFLEQLPGRVNKFLDAATNNQLKVNIEVIDEGSIINGLQKVANRITLGLLLAALIVGAAMLMRVDTAFRLFGYPGFAMLFFLFAAAGAIWLAFTILSTDRPARR